MVNERLTVERPDNAIDPSRPSAQSANELAASGRPRRWRPFWRPLFADAKVSEDHVQHVFHIDPAEKLAERARREAKVLGHDLLLAVFAGPLRAHQRQECFLQMRLVALARDQGRLGGEKSLGELRQRRNQLI